MPKHLKKNEEVAKDILHEMELLQRQTALALSEARRNTNKFAELELKLKEVLMQFKAYLEKVQETASLMKTLIVVTAVLRKKGLVTDDEIQEFLTEQKSRVSSTQGDSVRPEGTGTPPDNSGTGRSELLPAESEVGNRGDKNLGPSARVQTQETRVSDAVAHPGEASLPEASERRK